MTKPSPQPIGPKSGDYGREANTFAAFNDLFRFFATKRLKVSRNSPPVLNVDVSEGELILDKTALRIYTVVDNTLRYWSLT